MQQFLVFLIVSASAVSVHAADLAPRPVQEAPAAKINSQPADHSRDKGPSKVPVTREQLLALQKELEIKQQAISARLDLKRESMTELERIAVKDGAFDAPKKEEIMPYRFEDVTRLQSMLSDPQWSSSWRRIATTIGMAADKKAALGLVEFIKNGPLPEGYEARASAIRLGAITALAHTIVDQDIPEVLEFLQRLTDSEYAQSLNLGHAVPADSVRYNAYLALAAAATDESLAILEGLLNGAQAKKARMSVQGISVGGAESSKPNETAARDIRMLEQYLEFGKRRRAGLE